MRALHYVGWRRAEQLLCYNTFVSFQEHADAQTCLHLLLSSTQCTKVPVMVKSNKRSMMSNVLVLYMLGRLRSKPPHPEDLDENWPVHLVGGE